MSRDLSAFEAGKSLNFDILIRGGEVLDGSGRPAVRKDIGIRGDRIEVIDDLTLATAITEIDAQGHVVAPGFIDAHTHSDMAAFLDESDVDVAAAAVRQGVTTEVTGNCGFSPFPHMAGRKGEIERHISALMGTAPIRWRDLAGYRADLRVKGTRTNIAPLVGHGSVRAGVMGFADRPPSAEELTAMRRLLRHALDDGAFGFSSGLIYTPGAYASTRELVAMCKVASARQSVYTTHIRGETHMVADAVREALRIGREASLPVHISHHKTAGRENWGRTEETLEIIDTFRRSGQDVTIDMYPYTAASTLLSTLLPPWVQDGGLDAMLERLGSAIVRDRVKNDFKVGLPGWENTQRAAGWDGTVVSSCPGDPAIEGRTLAELADAAGQEPADYCFDLLVEHAGRVLMILHMMDEPDVTRVLAYEGAMIGSDGIPLPGKPHPRWAGSFCRILGHYSRDQRLFDLPTAVHKMTGLAAERFGLRDRGFIETGKRADLVVFHPELVIDNATFTDPLQPPSGIRDVLVNGIAVVQDGALTSAKPGQVLAAR